MLFQLIVGPFSTLHTLPKGMGVLLLTMTAIISSISLGTTGVKAGQTRAPEIANLIISFFFITLSLLGFVWQFGWHRLENNFDCLPWLPMEGAKLVKRHFATLERPFRQFFLHFVVVSTFRHPNRNNNKNFVSRLLE